MPNLTDTRYELLALFSLPTDLCDLRYRATQWKPNNVVGLRFVGVEAVNIMGLKHFRSSIFLTMLVSFLLTLLAMNMIKMRSMTVRCCFCIARSTMHRIGSAGIKHKTTTPISPQAKEVLFLVMVPSRFQNQTALSRSPVYRASDRVSRPRRPSIPRPGCRCQGFHVVVPVVLVVTMRYGPSWDLQSINLRQQTSNQKNLNQPKKIKKKTNSPCTNPPNTRLPVCNNGCPTTIFKNRSNPLLLSSITLSSKRFRYTFPGRVGIETRALSRSSRSRKTSKSE
jgi:hypothetical protein